MGESKENDNTLCGDELLKFVRSWLYDAKPPEPPEDASPLLMDLVAYLNGLRQMLAAFSSGNIEHPVNIRGFVGGHLKALQANLRHLTWQARMVSQGDLRQRVSFMGEFSQAFNEMVVTLEQNMHDLAAARDQLAELNQDLLVRIKRQEITEENLKRSEKHFRELAITDNLTKALTRHHFFVTASLEMGRIISEHSQMCLLMIDIDLFKNVNDTYGHLVGDQVLRGVADIFRATLRERDVLARYGGEEFIVMLPRARRSEGQQVAERLRQAVAATPIKTDKGDISITISIGVVFWAALQKYNYHQRQIEPLLLRMMDTADLALYQAKDQGRNKVIFGGPDDGDFSQILEAEKNS